MLQEICMHLEMYNAKHSSQRENAHSFFFNIHILCRYMNYVHFYQMANAVKYSIVFSEFSKSSIQFHNSHCQVRVINIMN